MGENRLLTNLADNYDAGEIVMAMEASLEPESLDAPGVYSKTEELEL